MPVKFDILLRRAEREDLDTIVEWMDDPDFLRFLYGDPARSPKQIREHIVGMLGRSVGNTMPGGVYLIVESERDGPVGLVGLQNISWRNRHCSIDLYIGKKERRSSWQASVAFYRTMEYCFDELNLHRVTAYIYAFNTASWRVMEMSGAKRELVLTDHVSRDGRMHDMYGYGLLRSDFQTLRERVSRIGGASLLDMIASQKSDKPPETGE